MRGLHRLAFLFVPAGAIACTALLGDYTVGDAGVGDAPNDSSPADVLSDSATDSGDGGDGSTLFTLSCGLTNGSETQVTNGYTLNPTNARIALLADDSLRIVVVDYPQSDGGGNPSALLHCFTADSHNLGQGFQDIQLQTGAYNVWDVTRYAGVQPGWAVVFATSTGGLVSLYVTRLPDNATAWTTPVLVAQQNTFTNDQEDATFIVIDGPNEKYYVVFSQTTGMTQTIYGGSVTGGPTNGALASLQSYNTTANNRGVFQLVKPGIAMGGTQPFVMLQPTGNNGPPPLGAPAYILVPPGNPIALQASNLNILPLAFESALNPQNSNLAFLVADLTNLTGSYNIGQSPVSALATLNPQTLPSSVPKTDASFSLENLFISADTQHWENAGGGEQFLVTSTTNDPLSNDTPGGINFGWWDAPTGTLRGYNGGNNNLLRTQAPFVISSDVTFATLVGSIAQLYVVYTNAQAAITQQFPPPPAELWIAQIACQKP